MIDTTTTLLFEDIHAYVRDTVIDDDTLPVWPFERVGDGQQVVVANYSPVPMSNVVGAYESYPVQVAAYVPCTATEQRFATQRLALRIAGVVESHFDALKGHTSMAPGVQFSGWAARTVQVRPAGIVESIPISGGVLYKAVVTVIFLTVTPQEATEDNIE
jgi:hypothetical protein